MLTKREIIEKYEKEKLIEKFVANTAKTSNEDIKDLCQDIYLALLLYDEDKIVQMYEKGELEFFVARMICNQYRSQTSPFYSKYRKWSDKRSELRGEPKISDSEIDEEYRWMTEKKSAVDC